MDPTWTSECGTVKLWLGDAVEIMTEWPDDAVECVVTDPNYGIGEADGKNVSRGKLATSRDYGKRDWDNSRPPQKAFDEIQRIGREQFIFGGNYFADLLPPSSSWYVWDKDNGATDFADVELAWTSHQRAARRFRFRWQGMLQEPGEPKETRVHPTQKPVRVMADILKRYTNEGDLIADPYSGSATTAIACLRTGRRVWAIEREADYFWKSVERIQAELNRFPLLEGVGVNEPKQQAMSFQE